MDADLQEPSNLLIPVDDDTNRDEALDEVAQGMTGTSDETADGTGEIDAIGHAAGLLVRDGKPLRGIDEVERRDDHRWGSIRHRPKSTLQQNDAEFG